MHQSRTFGYARHASDPEVESVARQKAIIADYAHRLGRKVDGVFVDGADSGVLSLFDREAGRQLMKVLRKGDYLIIPRLDRLSRSLMGFGPILEFLNNVGVVTYLCDVAGGVLDPRNPYSQILTRILMKFAEHGRRMIGRRTRRGLAVLKAENRRYCRNAPYGQRWERRGKSSVMVTEPSEKAICVKAAQLQAEGYCIDDVRQILAYKLKLRNRNGREFNYASTHKLILCGQQWLNSEASARDRS